MNTCRTLAPFILVCAVVAANAEAPSGENFDALIVNIQARGCTYSIAINGRSNELLSGDATASATASVPLNPDWLERTNELEIAVAEVADDALVAIDIVGMNLDNERLMSDDQQGSVLSVRLEAGELRAAARRSRKVSFRAPLRDKYQVPTDEEVFAYAEKLVGMFLEKDIDRIVRELLYSSRGEKRYQGKSDSEIIAALKDNMRAGIGNVSFHTVDPDHLFIMPMFGGLKYRLMAVEGDRKVDLIRFSYVDDPDATSQMRITVVKVDDEIVIDAMR